MIAQIGNFAVITGKGYRAIRLPYDVEALGMVIVLPNEVHAPYVRYVDDFALFHDDPAILAGWWLQSERYLVGRRLKLHPHKTMILSCAEPSQFLGYELHADGYRRPKSFWQAI